jgi:hypothetical protein
LPPDASLFEVVADFERRRMIEQLETSDWSQTAAAEALRIPLSTLNQKIKRLNIEIRKKWARHCWTLRPADLTQPACNPRQPRAKTAGTTTRLS